MIWDVESAAMLGNYWWSKSFCPLELEQITKACFDKYRLPDGEKDNDLIVNIHIEDEDEILDRVWLVEVELED